MSAIGLANSSGRALGYVAVALVTLSCACQQNARHKEYRAVKATFERECRRGDAEQCAYLAWLHHSVRAFVRKASSDKAIPMFRAACEAGSANACLGAKLVTKARGLWKQACAKGDIATCNELIATTIEMAERRRALKVMDKACTDVNTDGRACSMLADEMYKQDRPRWLELARTGCKRGYQPACARLGSRLYRGVKVQANVEAAVALWSAGCKQNHAQSCGLLSIHFIIDRKRTRANELVKQATASWKAGCRAAQRDACDQHLLWLARPAVRKRCLSGDPAACREIMTLMAGFATWRERLDFPRDTR